MDCDNPRLCPKGCDPMPPNSFALFLAALILLLGILGGLHLLESLP